MMKVDQWITKVTIHAWGQQYSTNVLQTAIAERWLSTPCPVTPTGSDTVASS